MVASNLKKAVVLVSGGLDSATVAGIQCFYHGHSWIPDLRYAVSGMSNYLVIPYECVVRGAHRFLSLFPLPEGEG